MDQQKFNRIIDISNFLPNTSPSILTSLYEETEAIVLTHENFMELPVNDDYKKKQEEKLLTVNKAK
jgi:hypothetical protein